MGVVERAAPLAGALGTVAVAVAVAVGVAVGVSVLVIGPFCLATALRNAGAFCVAVLRGAGAFRLAAPVSGFAPACSNVMTQS